MRAPAHAIGRRRFGAAALAVMIAGLWAAWSSAQEAKEGYGPWEVRRGRTTDSAQAGGYPTWAVTFEGDEEAPTVTIAGDEDGKARGTILIGRRVSVGEDSFPGLDFAYATHCDMDERSGDWIVAAIPVEAWDALGRSGQTEVIFDRGSRKECLLSWRVLSHVGEDVDAPVPWDTLQRDAQAAGMIRFRGKEIVLAAAWTGYHGVTEWASLVNLHLIELVREDAMRQFFRRLNLDHPGLETVKAAVEGNDMAQATQAAAGYFRGRSEPRFPGDPRDREGHKVSEEAEAALENRFTGQSAYGLQPVPEDIPWDYNPGDDPEWTWQFNRHSAWRALAEAYLATGDEKYAEKWVALLQDWVAENPPGTPWSWRTLEAGIRAQGWFPVLLSFLSAEALEPEDLVTVLNSMADHAEYLLPDGRFHSGSNWGQTESNGLLYLGTFLPEFKAAKTWRETAWARLEDEMFAQVLEDGAQVELTTSYHQGTIRGFVRAADIAALSDLQPSDEYWRRLERMYEYTMFLQKPDGTQPMLGDSWPGNTRGIVAEGARRFDRPDMLWVATAGREGEPPDYLDTQLTKAGYYVMRTAWNDPQGIYLLTDAAHRWGGGHQQPDALGLILYAYGKTLTPDSGSYLYYGEGRRAMARTSQHSTIVVDEKDQNTSAATLHAWDSSELMSFVDASHEGYEGIVSRRKVLFARPAEGVTPYFVVVDSVSGEGEHTVDQMFHFLPSTLDLEATEGIARTRLDAGPNLEVRQLRLAGMAFEAVDSWVSFRYTKREPRPACRLRHSGALPAAFVTVLVPYPGTEPPPVQAVELPIATPEPGVAAVRVRIGDTTDTLLIAPQPRDFEVEGLRANCRAGLVRARASVDEIEMSLVDGDEAEVADVERLRLLPGE